MLEGAWMSRSFSRYYLPLALKWGLVALESRWYRSHNWYGIIESEQINGMNYFMQTVGVLPWVGLSEILLY